MTVRQKVLGRSVLTAKCPYGKVSSRRKVVTAKYHHGDVSLRLSVRTAKRHTAKSSTAKSQVTEKNGWVNFYTENSSANQQKQAAALCCIIFPLSKTGHSDRFLNETCQNANLQATIFLPKLENKSCQNMFVLHLRLNFQTFYTVNFYINTPIKCGN